MLIVNYLLIALLIGTVVALYFCAKKGVIKLNITRFIKILSCILIGVFFFRYMLGNEAIQDTFELKNSVFESKFINAVVLFMNWFLNASILLVCMYPFFKQIKWLNVLIKYFALPTSVLASILYVFVAKGISGRETFWGFDFRAFLLAIENAILVSNCFMIFMENGRFKSSRTELKGLWFIPLILVFSVPAYMLQGTIGFLNSSMKVKGFTLYHRLVLYGSFIVPIILYFILYRQDDKTKRFTLLYISLATLISFSYVHRFESFLNVTGWPIHLCNTAMYIIPLCIIFKWEKLFYFTYFINVLGAFFAMAMPNYSDAVNLFSSSCIRFFINHYTAFYMPLLIVALNVFERPKLKQFKWSMIGFGIYFAIVLICNAWFSNYGDVDYFFVNSDFIAEKLGKWAEDLRLVVLDFNIGKLNFVFYPLYQSIFFIVYVLLGLAMWFIYEQGYAFVDVIKDISIRNKKINADRLAIEVSKAEKLNGGERVENIKEIKIELKNFSKRYGQSKNYAVKDANLVINGGEIFGFLGHNGAGKSTIIKSMVGIQPITSGSIEICGFDVDKEPVMSKKLIGFVPDHYALYEKLTGREYVNYIADLWGVGEAERNIAIEKYVKLFELENSFDNQIRTYSHGMKQKITIISALVHNPKVWILDEPLTGLDPNSIYQVKECMKQHAAAGNIVFFSSHIIDVVETICDRIAIIKKGKILSTKTLKEIEADCGLEQFYLKTTAEVIEPINEEENNKQIVEPVNKKKAGAKKK